MSDSDASRPTKDETASIAGFSFENQPEAEVPIPRQIGQYHILRIIGIGGMGTVYEAMQEHPHRRVALKVMKRGVSSRSALRRFEFESQILARLRHPGIAMVHEAGTHDDGSGGVPFFAMEYIPRAKTITGYARAKELGTREILKLFSKVCDSVQHGHQKGIIHRDLKPDNILVDANGQPKIIDFGVARATDSDMAVTTLQTDVGQLIGTLQYMSPEQCESDPNDLDTRSDIYALGVVLYELLCESLPYDIAGASIYEAARMIREVRPVTPSTVNGRLRGDVETITMKAMEKDRDRRYRTAADLSDDIRRYLHNEPISATPPGTIYRLRMFARRHRALVVGVAAVFTVLAASTIVMSVLYANKARAERTAERQAQIARAVNVFLNQDLLAAVDPKNTPNREITVREALDVASRSIDERFASEPLVEAATRLTIGSTYTSLGEYASALPHLLRSRELSTRELGADAPETLAAMSELGKLDQAMTRYDDAEVLLTDALDGCRRTLGADHEDTLSAMNDLAALYLQQGKYEEAQPLLLTALERQRATLGEAHVGTLATMTNLATLYDHQGKLEDAIELSERALAVSQRVLGSDHPEVIVNHNNLAKMHQRSGAYDTAVQGYEEAYAVAQRVLGDEHRYTIVAMSNLADLYRVQGRHAEAETMAADALELSTRTLGARHNLTLTLATTRARQHIERGRYLAARPLLESSVRVLREEQGDQHPTTLSAMHALADLNRKDKRYGDAERLARQLLDVYMDIDPDSPHTMRAMIGLALLYREQGRFEQAEPLYLDARRGYGELYGAAHLHTLIATGNLGDLYREMGRLGDSEQLLRTAVQGKRAALPAGSTSIAVSLMQYGRCLTGLERYEDSEVALQEAYEIFSNAFSPTHQRTVTTAEALSELYEAWKKPELAAEWQAKTNS